MKKFVLFLTLVMVTVFILTIQPTLASGPIYYDGDDFNIVVIGVDGTIRNRFMNMYSKGKFPNLQLLSGDKIYNLTITNGATDTKTGWTQFFTGYKAEVTGVYSNYDYQPIPEGYTIFEKLEDHFGDEDIATAFYGAKGANVGGVCPGEEGEVFGQPWCLVKNNLDHWENQLGKNANVLEKALWFLDTYSNQRFFAFFHLREPDRSGHKFGEDSPEYRRRLKKADSFLGEIVAKLDDKGIYHKTYVWVVSDHGFDRRKTHHKNAPFTFFASNDPNVVRSANRMDFTPTWLEKYGISLGPIENAPAVNGQSLYSIPTGCVPEGEGFVDYSKAPQCCPGLTLTNLSKLRKNGGCRKATGGKGDLSGYCTNCGDGECVPPENKCNCPVDCDPEYIP
ncbi:MAG: alkaline phosphatase family protein [archaeon]